MSIADLDAPTYDVDLYSDEVLRDPYPHYRAIRRAAPPSGFLDTISMPWVASMTSEQR